MTDLRFGTRTVRYLTLQQKNWADNWWTIGEAHVFSPDAVVIAEPPATPNLRAITQNGSVQVAWDHVSNETGYVIERKTGNGNASWSPVATTTADTTTWSDATATIAGAICAYRVTTTNAAGSSGTSAERWTVRATNTGSVSWARWSIAGTAVSAIDPAVIPTLGGVLTKLETTTNRGDNYGELLRGYIKPSTGGSRRFWIAGDDGCEFWLSPSSNPAAKVKQCSVTGWTNAKQWSKYPSQKSAVVTLTAGATCYFEILHKEGTGGDHVAVGWANSSTATTPTRVVPGANLLPY